MVAAGESRVQGIVDRIIAQGDEVTPEVFDQIETAALNGYDLTVDNEERAALEKLGKTKLLGSDPAVQTKLYALKHASTAGDYLQRLQRSYDHCQSAPRMPEDEITETEACILPKTSLRDRIHERIEGTLTNDIVVDALNRSWISRWIGDGLTTETFRRNKLSFDVSFPAVDWSGIRIPTDTSIIHVRVHYRDSGGYRQGDIHFQHDDNGSLILMEPPSGK